MKQLKILMLLIFAAAFTFSSCGDDDEENAITTAELQNGVTFSGSLSTKVSFNPGSSPYIDYTNDNTSVTVKMENDGTLTIVVASMTAKPASGDSPASLMTNIIIKKVTATRLADGSFQLSINAEDFAGIAGGTMNGKFSPYKKGTVTGTISGSTLRVSIEGYKFTDSSYEPTMKSDFLGKRK